LVNIDHEGHVGTPFDRLYDEMRAAAGWTNGRVRFLKNEAAVFGSGSERVHVLGCSL
jgi:hypothetical protein